MPMPMRQLQRPLTLTQPIAAAWRPKLPRLPARGSIQPQFSTTARPRAPEETPQQPPQKSSLFAELFPDEAKQRARLRSWAQAQTQASTENADGQGLVKPPPRTLSPLPQSAHPLISYYEDSSHHPAAASTQRCTVVLNAASKYLTESDFYRVGAGRAAHVEGWVGGITKVIQARDPDTLEPLGRYYIIFETAAAAAAWREEVKRLWKLSRAHTPGVIRQGGTKGTGNFPVEIPLSARSTRSNAGSHSGGGSVGELEAIKREVEGFTLVAPGMRWDLDVAKYTAEERAMEHAGSLVEKLCRKAETKFLVMIAVSGGKISSGTLRTAIKDDGKQRGLPWRVKNLEAKVGEGKWGIMPFGKSGLKAAERASIQENMRETEDRTMHIEPDANVEKIKDEFKRYPRFLVPFLDEAEARRFVRNWHRRQLTLKMGREDVDIQSVEEWEETRVFNVTLLW
ncbi:hypothetical protein SCUP234_08884 [Seiridium cupressi]